MPDVVVLVTLFVVGTLIAYKVIHSPYRPSVGFYIILFFVFALPLFFVFTFIPLIIVRRKTKNKPVAPPARYELQRHSSIRDDDDELNCLRNEPDYVNDPAFRSFADNIFSDRDHY